MIVEKMISNNLWDKLGKTPNETIAKIIESDIKNKGSQSLVIKKNHEKYDLVISERDSEGLLSPIPVKEKISYLDYVEIVLQELNIKKPLHYKDIVKRVISKGCLITDKKENHYYIRNILTNDIKDNKHTSKGTRFIKYGHAYFGLRNWIRPDRNLQKKLRNQVVKNEIPQENLIYEIENILKSSGQPLHAAKIVEEMVLNDIWDQLGDTPNAFIAHIIESDIKNKGSQSLFIKKDFDKYDLVTFQTESEKIAFLPPIKQNQGNLSYIDCAEKVLQELSNKIPMHCKEIVEIAVQKGWLVSNSIKLVNNMKILLNYDIKRHDKILKTSRFIRYGHSYYGLSQWIETDSISQNEKLTQQINNKVHQNTLLNEIKNILVKARKPLTPTLISEHMLFSGQWKMLGIKPIETISSIMDSDIDERGDKSIFVEEDYDKYNLRSIAIKDEAVDTESTSESEAPLGATFQESSIEEETLQESSVAEPTLQATPVTEPTLQGVADAEVTLQETSVTEPTWQESLNEKQKLHESFLADSFFNGNFSYVKCAEMVLLEVKKPLHFMDITIRALERGWLDTSNKNPEIIMERLLNKELEHDLNNKQIPRFTKFGFNHYGLQIFEPPTGTI
jgi:DNA-directed RNA polymerase delta subunit